MQQCDNGSRPAWKAGAQSNGLEVRVLSAAPYMGRYVQLAKTAGCKSVT